MVIDRGPHHADVPVPPYLPALLSYDKPAGESSLSTPALSFDDVLNIAIEYERAHHVPPSTGAKVAESVPRPRVNAMSLENILATPVQLSNLGMDHLGRPFGRHPSELAPPSIPAFRSWHPPNGQEMLDIELMESFPPSSTKPSWEPLSSPALYVNFSGLSPIAGLSEPTVPTPQQPKTAEVPSRTVLASIQAPTAPEQRWTRPYVATVTASGYTCAPRGGVPPQLARDVTRANILQIEQERDRVRMATFQSGSGTRKPSVLQDGGHADPGKSQSFATDEWISGGRKRRKAQENVCRRRKRVRL